MLKLTHADIGCYDKSSGSPIGLFLERLHDPADRRGALVSLTREGLRLIDMAVTTRMVVEETMLRSFSLSDRKKFAELLRTVLQDLEVIKKERHSSVEAGNRQIPQR